MHITLFDLKTNSKRAYFYKLKHVSIVELLNFIEQLEVQAKHICKVFEYIWNPSVFDKKLFLVSNQETKS